MCSRGSTCLILPFSCPCVEGTWPGLPKTKHHCLPGSTTCVSQVDGTAQLRAVFLVSTSKLTPEPSFPTCSPSHLSQVIAMASGSFPRTPLGGQHPQGTPTPALSPRLKDDQIFNATLAHNLLCPSLCSRTWAEFGLGGEVLCH